MGNGRQEWSPATPAALSSQEQLRLMSIVFETGQATIITDDRQRILKVNQAFTRITGFSVDEVLGETPRLFKSGRHGREFYERLWGALKQEGHWQGEVWNRNKEGSIYPVWQSITAVKGDAGYVSHYVSVFHDIAERKRIEQTLSREASRDHLTGAANRRTFDRSLISLIRNAQSSGSELSIMLFDIDHFKSLNDDHGHDVGDTLLYAITRLVQERLRKTDLLARWGGDEFTLLLPDTPLQGALQLAERLRADVEAADLDPKVTISIGLAAFRTGDSARDLLLRVDGALYRAKHAGRNRVGLDPAAGEALGTSGPAESLLHEAPCYIDEYRGASRRAQLSRLLEDGVDQAGRRNGTLTVCVLDVDHFKQVNERLGSSLADQLIRALAQRLKSQLGQADIVVRTGGDEFVLLMRDIADDGLIEQLLDVIRQPFQLGGHSLAISASLGVARFPDDEPEADVLLRHAQQAMYRAKQNGRNTLTRFDPGQDRQVRRSQTLRRRIEQAIMSDELRLHYQPQIDMITAHVVGCEALVRWEHPEKGLLAPAEFLPAIEGTWLESMLDEWVLRAVLEQLSRWEEESEQLPVLPVSVNISPSYLLSPGFVAQLAGLLSTYSTLTPSRLKLEVVETAAMHDITAAIDVISRCQAMGIQVAIDDFGTGFSSLTYLRRLPVDLIKVDKSFVRDMLCDQNDRDIVESVIYMAKRFDRDLLAEGVESIEHAKDLLSLGCHLAQGYGIARPMPAEALPGWLAEWPQRRDWASLEERNTYRTAAAPAR